MGFCSDSFLALGSGSFFGCSFGTSDFCFLCLGSGLGSALSYSFSLRCSSIICFFCSLAYFLAIFFSSASLRFFSASNSYFCFRIRSSSYFLSSSSFFFSSASLFLALLPRLCIAISPVKPSIFPLPAFSSFPGITSSLGVSSVPCVEVAAGYSCSACYYSFRLCYFSRAAASLAAYFSTSRWRLRAYSSARAAARASRSATTCSASRLRASLAASLWRRSYS